MTQGLTGVPKPQENALENNSPYVNNSLSISLASFSFRKNEIFSWEQIFNMFLKFSFVP
jgi:hypothetical protein